MGRTKDVFWNYAVEEPNDRFRCKFCSRVFAGGIPRVKSHLSGVKGRGIAICSEVPEEVRVAARSALDGASFDKAKVAAASSDIVSNIEVASTSSKSANLRGKDHDMVHTELARFLMSNSIAFDVVDSQSFVNFVTGVAGAGLRYKLPNSEDLKTEFVPNVEKEAAAYIKDVRKSWGTTGCTIMLDTGTESSNLFAYCPRGAVYLGSCKISKDSRTADIDVKNIVAEAIEDIGAENVVQFIANDAYAFRSATDLLDSKYPKIYKIRCVANTLHLLFKNIYEKVESVKLTIDRAKSIVDCLYEDVALLSLMKRHTDNTELKRLYWSVFASSYQMLQAVIQNEDGLRQLVESAEWRVEWRAEWRAEVTTIVRTTEFWRDGQEVLEILKPLIQVLSLVEDKGATSGYLYAAMEMARKEIAERCRCSVACNVFELFKQKRDDILHPVHAAAAFLNPAYMCHESFEEDSAMRESISYIVETMVADHERQQFIREVQLYRRKEPKLFSIMAKEMLETSHPSLWWEYCGDCVPVLRKCALRILSQPCKCLWEHKFGAGEVARRHKPDGEHRMTMNVTLMEMYTNLQADLLRPICLENCHELPKYDDRDQDLGSGNNKEPRGKSSAGCATNGVELILLDEEEVPEEEPAVSRDPIPGSNKAGEKRSREEGSTEQHTLEPAATRVFYRGSGEDRASQGDIRSFGGIEEAQAPVPPTEYMAWLYDRFVVRWN